MDQNLELNKKNAVVFYRTAYMGEPDKAIEEYVGTEYIQHNPAVKNGKVGFIDYFIKMSKDFPKKEIEFVRVIAEGDLVALQTHQTWPGNDEYITMDFFRFNIEGKIIEHWDSIQQIPEKNLCGNPMY